MAVIVAVWILNAKYFEFNLFGRLINLIVTQKIERQNTSRPN